MTHCDEAAVGWLRFGSGFLVVVALLLLSGVASSFFFDEGSHPLAHFETGVAALLLVLAAFGIGGTFAHHGGARWILLPYFVLHVLLLSGVVGIIVALDIFETAPAATDFIHRVCSGESPPEWCGTSEEEDDLTLALADHWDLISVISNLAFLMAFLNITAAYVTASHPPAERRTIVDMHREHVAHVQAQQSLQQPMMAPPQHTEPYYQNSFQYSNVGGKGGMQYQHPQYQHPQPPPPPPPPRWR